MTTNRNLVAQRVINSDKFYSSFSKLLLKQGRKDLPPPPPTGLEMVDMLRQNHSPNVLQTYAENVTTTTRFKPR